MACSKSSAKREVYNNTRLTQKKKKKQQQQQEKTLNKQPNFTPKATRKGRTRTAQS